MSPLKPILKKISLIVAGFLGAAILGIVLWLDRAPQVDVTLPEQLQQDVARIAGKNVNWPAVVPEIGLPELKRLIDSQKLLLIDARYYDYYKREHLPGALCLPLDSFEKSYHDLAEAFVDHHGQPFVVYCANSQCPNAGYIARALIALGHRNILRFPGGVTEWKQTVDIPR